VDIKCSKGRWIDRRQRAGGQDESVSGSVERSATPSPAAERDRPCFAACTLGLEPALEGELVALGARWIEPRCGGVRFAAPRRIVYAAGLWLRSAVHVQEQIAESKVRSADELYDWAKSIDWSRFLSSEQTLAVDAAVRDSALTHSQYAALRIKDAVADWFRERQGVRPSVDVEDPDLPLKLVVRQNVATLYRSVSGPSLHKRGYRPIQVRSPLNEATAAGLLLLSDWDRRSPLADPMCGSGTFVIEAAMLAADRAPGLARRFAFERWPDFAPALWDALRADARRRALATLPFLLEGADRHPGAIAIASLSAERAGVAGLVRFTPADLLSFLPQATPRCVVVNPPYGERLGEGEDLEESWRRLGAFLRERCAGAAAWVLSGNPGLTRRLGLRASRKLAVRNGPIDCRWLRYAIDARPSRPEGANG
jgi:putative N6-adenine-specific DNA methylase